MIQPLLLTLALAPQDAPAPWFTEVGTQAGLDFAHVTGREGEFWFPEIMGGGVALLDYDGDGLLDVYLVQSGKLPAGPDESTPEGNPGNKLFRNLGVVDGQLRFADVTEEAGVGDTGYGMGAACGDYDRDGDMDLYVTNVGVNVLYRNEGPDANGVVRFKDVTPGAPPATCAGRPARRSPTWTGTATWTCSW